MKKLLLYLILFTSFNLTGQINNYSLEFDGVDDEIICNNPLQPNMSEITIMFLAKFSSTNYATLITDWPAGGATFKIDTYSDTLRFDIITSVGYFQTKHTLSTNDFNAWINWAYTYNGDTAKVYKNGVLVEVNTSVDGTISPSSSVIRFANEENNQAFWNGYMDEPHFWNIALTEQEVQNYMNCPPTGNEVGLVGYWNFEEGSGTTTADQTSNANDGTINGATWSTDIPPYNCCTANPITSQPTDQTVNLGNNATISFTDSLTGASYQWQMDAGTGYSSLSNAGQFSGTDSDSLIISTTTMGNNNTNYRCIVTESANCIATTDVANLTVIDNTSISELNNSLVKLFPNPSNDIITLTLAQHSNGQLILTDILGKEVLSKSFTSNEVQLNLKILESKGTYFTKVLDSDGNVIAIKKLIYQ